MDRITVYLADWQVLFREGIHFTLSGEDDIEVVGETTSNEEALAFIENNAPQVSILNANKSKLTGIEITRRIKQNMPTLAIILVMDDEDDEALFSAIKTGANACVTKDIDPEELLNIIREVAYGKQPISAHLFKPEIALSILDEFEACSLINQQVNNLLARLTPREAEILSNIGEGKSEPEIASALTINEVAVRHHLDLILTKLVANDHSRQLLESMHQGLPALGTRNPLGHPEIEYITRDEFTVFKDNVKKNLEALFG